MSEQLSITEFNAEPVADLVTWLEQLCSAPRWAAALADGRPYADGSAVLDASDRVFATLEPADIDAALAGHPRIGDQVDGAGQGADLSRSEQASMSTADDEVRQQLRAGNVAYEQRFNRVFLIRAAGRSPQEMLTELQRRLRNNEQTEEVEVAEQLRQITRLRLEGALTR